MIAKISVVKNKSTYLKRIFSSNKGNKLVKRCLNHMKRVLNLTCGRSFCVNYVFIMTLCFLFLICQSVQQSRQHSLMSQVITVLCADSCPVMHLKLLAVERLVTEKNCQRRLVYKTYTLSCNVKHVFLSL